MFLKTHSGSFEVYSSLSADFIQLGIGPAMEKQSRKKERKKGRKTHLKNNVGTDLKRNNIYIIKHVIKARSFQVKAAL